MQKEIIDRLKQEGALLRNSGAHSIKSVKEILVTNNELVTSSLNSIQGLLLLQNSILSGVLDVQKQIAKTLDENLAFDQETERDRARNERLNDQDQDPEPEKKSVVSRVLGTAKNILKKTPSILAKIVAGLLAGPIIFGFLKAAFKDIVENSKWAQSILGGLNSVLSAFGYEPIDLGDGETPEVGAGDLGASIPPEDGADYTDKDKERFAADVAGEGFPEDLGDISGTGLRVIDPKTGELVEAGVVPPAPGGFSDAPMNLEATKTFEDVPVDESALKNVKPIIEDGIEKLVVQKFIDEQGDINEAVNYIKTTQPEIVKNNTINKILENILIGSPQSVSGLFKGEEEFQRLVDEIFEQLKNLDAPDQTSSLILNPSINIPEIQTARFTAVPEIPTPSLETQVAMLNASGGGMGGFSYMGGSTVVYKDSDQIITNAPTNVTNIALSDKDDASGFVSYV